MTIYLFKESVQTLHLKRKDTALDNYKNKRKKSLKALVYFLN